MKTNYLALFILSIILFSCQEKESNKQIPPQPIKVVDVQPQSLPIYKEYVGQIYGERDIPIRARAEGFLTKIHFDEGSSVKKNQLLYSIDPDPYREQVAAQQSMVSQANTILIQTEADLQRIIPLAEIDAVSQRDLDMAVAQRDAAISSVKAAEANLNIAEINMSYTNIHSPIDGVIGKTLAREGEFVGREPNPVILNTVSNLEAVRVQFFLSENEYLIIARERINQLKTEAERDVQKINIQLILADGSLYKHKGKMDFIDRSVDPSTGAILLQASFPNPDGLIRPGQFARVKIKVMDKDNALVVPQKSLTELQGKYSVLIVNAENKIETVQVEVGEKIGDICIINKGLKKGNKVVIEGLQKVRPGMVVIPEVTEFKSQSNL